MHQAFFFTFLIALKYKDGAALAEASRGPLQRSLLADLRAVLEAFQSLDRDTDYQRYDRCMIRLRGE